MSNLVQELRIHGFHVPDPKQPLAEMETGRLGGLRKELLPEISLQELLAYLPVNNTRSYQYWDGGKPPKEPNASKLVEGLSKAVSDVHGLPVATARQMVLERLTARQTQETADEINHKAMQAILNGANKYLFDKELEEICSMAALAIVKRKDQILPNDSEAFEAYANLLGAWHDFKTDRRDYTDEQLATRANSLNRTLRAYEKANKNET